MADQKYQQTYPLAPAASGHPQSDEESVRNQQSKKQRKKRRMKWSIYIVLFIIFQVAIITTFALTVMKIENPKVRLGQITLKYINTNANTPSFNMSFNAQLSVRNPNFGHYKFAESIASFAYHGMIVGEVVIPRARVRARSTKNFDVGVDLSLTRLTSTQTLGSDIGLGVLTLTSQSKLSGKVILMKVMKKKKYIEMNCTIIIHLSSKQVQDLICK